MEEESRFPTSRQGQVRRGPKGDPSHKHSKSQRRKKRSTSSGKDRCESQGDAETSESGSHPWMGETGQGDWTEDESSTFHQSETEGGVEGLPGRMDRGWEEVSSFATMVWKIDLKNKTLSQMAVVLVKLIGHCPGMLGPLAQETLRSAAS